MGGGSRGKKKPKLRDYSQKPLTPEEKNALFEAVSSDRHPVATAILGAVMVEHELEVLLLRRFKRNDDDTWETLIGDRGPLGTLSAKITAGYALGIYDEKLQHDLNVVRTIRNAFAHSKKILTFHDPLIVAEIVSVHCIPKKFRNSLQKDPTEKIAQANYVQLCFRLAVKLIQRGTKAIVARGKAYQRRLRKKFENSPIARALIGGFGVAPFAPPPLPPSSSKLNPLSSPPGQNVDPNRSTLPGLLSGLFGLGEEALRRKQNDKE